MNEEEIKTLVAEDKDSENKRRSRKRLFIAFLIADVILISYLIYSLIFFFTHL